MAQKIFIVNIEAETRQITIFKEIEISGEVKGSTQ